MPAPKPARNMLPLVAWLFGALLLSAACQGLSPQKAPLDPATFVASPELTPEEVAPYFAWNLPGMPRQDNAPGDVVPIIRLESPEEYERAEALNMAACPSSDYHASFVKAYHLVWRRQVQVSYCFREGLPDRERFQIYYLPVLEIVQRSAPEGEDVVCRNREEDPDLAFSPVWGVCLDDPPPPDPDWPGENLLIFYATSPPGRNWDSPEAQSLDRVRFLLIETPSRLYTVNLSDAHTYLLAETRSRLAADPAHVGLLYGEEFHWRGIRPARLSLDACRAEDDASPPALWRDTLLRTGKTIHPRTSCVERSLLFADHDKNGARLGYVFQGYRPGRAEVGWLLLRQGESLSAFPLDYSAHPDVGAGVRAVLKVSLP